VTRPRWCGNPACDPQTRMVEVGDERRPERCPCLTTATGHAALVTERQRLQGRIDEIDRQLAAMEAPDWARGPGVRS
jgi:hypothetical protein